MSAAHADVLRHANAAYLTFARDSEQRRMIEYLNRRLSAAPKDEQDAQDQAMLAKRLEDIIRPRTAGSFI